jgi:hypothetical protein
MLNDFHDLQTFNLMGWRMENANDDEKPGDVMAKVKDSGLR